MSDSEPCSNRLELDLISLLVNFSYELGQIMARFDFLWPRWVNLNNVQTDSQLDLISILVNFSCELGQISGSFQKKIQSGPKNLIRFYIALNLEDNFFFAIQNLVDIQSSRFRWYSFVFERTQSSSFIFGQFPVARKLIINGGAIRPTGLLFGLRYPEIFLLSVNGTCAHVPCEVIPVSINRCFQTIKAWMISAYGEEGVIFGGLT